MPVIAKETGWTAPGRSTLWNGLRWASLVALTLLLRPYIGLIHDARIYIGRGLADRDPTGLGHDLMFANDSQTAFSLFRDIVDGLLSVAEPGRLSMGVVAVGLLTWLGAASLLMRRLAGTRAAWAAVVAVLALPGDYGPLHIFRYAEAIATPRLFAEAAVIVGLERMLARQRLAALALLGLALAIHPLMALPGLALTAILLILEDRRWLVAVVALAVAACAAAGLGAPVLGRLFVAMDPDWLAVVRMRSANLFPTLWPAEVFAAIGCQAAAAIVAGTLGKPSWSGSRRSASPDGEDVQDRVGGLTRSSSADVPVLRAGAGGRALLWGGAAVGLGGLLLSLTLGDVLPSVLLLQLQTWRALWLLSVLGNAGLVLAAVGLWRGGPASRLVLALLILAFVSQATPVLALGLAATAVLCRFAQAYGQIQGLTPWIGRIALSAALAAAAIDAVAGMPALTALLLAPGADWHAVAVWPFVVASGVLTAPLLAGAVALAVAPARWLETSASQCAALVATLAACVAALHVWDSRDAEHRMIDAGQGAEELAADLGAGQGGLLWIEGRGVEAWFLARRPAFFSAIQGAPTVFSRPLALAWAARGQRLVALGLIHPGELMITGDGTRPVPISPTPDALMQFCRDPAEPAGLVVPGDQRAAVPDGLTARLWIPPSPVLRVSVGDEGPVWRAIDRLTVVSCAPPGPRRDGGS